MEGLIYQPSKPCAPNVFHFLWWTTTLVSWGAKWVVLWLNCPCIAVYLCAVSGSERWLLLPYRICEIIWHRIDCVRLLVRRVIKIGSSLVRWRRIIGRWVLRWYCVWKCFCNLITHNIPDAFQDFLYHVYLIENLWNRYVSNVSDIL